MKKNITPYRDDDQDSGFGGNYTGSTDEGGLAFDWSCYNSHLDVLPETVQCQVPGPTTSRSILRSPPPSIRSSRTEINQRNSESRVSRCELSSNVESDINVPLSSNDPEFSESRHGAENDLERGKRPLNKRNIKINAKSSVSAPSTLLQISLNGKASKINETESHANEHEKIDGICVWDDTISIQNNTSTIHDDVDNAEDDMNTLKCSGNKIFQCPFEDNTNPVQDTDTEASKGDIDHYQDSVDKHPTQSSTNSTVDNTDPTRNSTDLSHNTNSIVENTDPSEDCTNFLKDDSSSSLYE